MHENAINVGIPLRKPPYVKRQKVMIICIFYMIYIYIYYVSVTNSKIDLNLKFVTWSARYWYESIHQSYPHIPASMRQCPIRMFFLLTSLLTVNRKLWQFLVLISFSACIYIYIYTHDVCSVRQRNRIYRMKCKYDSMYVIICTKFQTASNLP